MPHHEEGYVSERISRLMNSNHAGGPVSILNFAQYLHDLTTGATDIWEDADDAVEVVKFYLEHWTPSKNKYDDTIKELLTIALEEFETSPLRAQLGSSQ